MSRSQFEEKYTGETKKTFKKVKNIVKDPEFWKWLDRVDHLLKPITDACKIFQGNHSNPATVIYHWNGFYRHVDSLKW